MVQNPRKAVEWWNVVLCLLLLLPEQTLSIEPRKLSSVLLSGFRLRRSPSFIRDYYNQPPSRTRALEVGTKKQLSLPYTEDQHTLDQIQWRHFLRQLLALSPAFKSEMLKLAKQISRNEDTYILQYLNQKDGFSNDGRNAKSFGSKELSKQDTAYYERMPAAKRNFNFKNFFPHLQISVSRNGPLETLPEITAKRFSTYYESGNSGDQATCLHSRFGNKSVKWICGPFSSGELGKTLFSDLCEADKRVLQDNYMAMGGLLEKCCQQRAPFECTNDTKKRHQMLIEKFLLINIIRKF